VKFGFWCGIIFTLYELGTHYLLSEVDAADSISWNGEDYKSAEERLYERGRIVYYSKNTEVCNSWVLIPGTALLPIWILAIAYGTALIYLFMGIGIISDIFMVSIEKITSRK
jgi:hypothetical protein